MKSSYRDANRGNTVIVIYMTSSRNIEHSALNSLFTDLNIALVSTIMITPTMKIESIPHEK